MILKTKFIELVDTLRSDYAKYVDCDDKLAEETWKNLEDLQATLVRGHNFLVKTEDLYLLNKTYDGFAAELRITYWLKRNKINFSYDGNDFYQDYVIQYGDPFINSKNTCDFIISDKRIDVKKTDFDYGFKWNKTQKAYENGIINNPNDNVYVKKLIKYYCAKKDEIERKKLDYFFVLDEVNTLLVIDIKKEEVIYVNANIGRADNYWFIWRKF